MSQRMFIRHYYWSGEKYAEDLDSLLDDWGLWMICLRGWQESTVAKYKTMIRAGSRRHFEVFNKWLIEQGYEEF